MHVYCKLVQRVPLTSHCSVFWSHCTSTSLVLSVPLNSVGASVWLRSTDGNWRSIPKLIRLNRLRVCWRHFSSSEQALFHWMVIPTVEMQVTWLILPVVICLSQRLSHACLSIALTRWNCGRLIISVIVYLMVSFYKDNCGKSRANTCLKSQLTKGGNY